MRWDEIIDPRLRAYRRESLARGGIVPSSKRLTVEELEEMHGRMAMTPEQLEQTRADIAEAFDLPREIIG